MILLTRVDHRLLHGQVATSWVNGLGSDCIFCVGDKVCLLYTSDAADE